MNDRGMIALPLPLVIAGVLALLLIPAVFIGNLLLSNTTHPAPEATEITPAPPPKKEPAATKSASFAPPAPRAVVPTYQLITPSSGGQSTGTGGTSGSGTAASSGTTRTGWKFAGECIVDVIPTLDTAKQNLYLDFESAQFSDVATVSYSVTYESGTGGLLKSAQGSFDPGLEKLGAASGGKSYIRKSTVLGTCSRSVCTYDTNPRNFTLIVTVERLSSDEPQLRTLTLKTS